MPRKWSPFTTALPPSRTAPMCRSAPNRLRFTTDLARAAHHIGATRSTTDTSSPPHVAPGTAALGRVNARLPFDALCPASAHSPPPPCPTQAAQPCVGLRRPCFAGSVTGRHTPATSLLSVHQVYGHGPPASLRVQRSGATHSRSCHPDRRRSANDWPASVLAKWARRGHASRDRSPARHGLRPPLCLQQSGFT